MAELERLHRELELLPCKNDREIKKKEQALMDSRAEIHELEKKRDRLMYTSWEHE